jgi:hypothetical protein
MLTSAGGTDGYLALLDGAGMFSRITRLGATRDDRLTAVGPGPSDGIVFAGWTYSDYDTVAGTFVDRPDTSAGSLPFLLAVSSDGAARFGRIFNSSFTPWIVTADSDGNIFMLAGFDSGEDVGGGPITGYQTETVDEAPVLVKYDASGAYQWALPFATGSNYRTLDADLEIDASGDTFMALAPEGDLDVGFSLPGAGGAMVIRVTRDGAITWARRVGGPEAEPFVGTALAREPRGTLLVLAITGPSPGVHALYRLDPTDGAVLGAWSLFPLGHGYVRDVGVDSSGNIYVTGSLEEEGGGYNNVLLAQYPSLE